MFIALETVCHMSFYYIICTDIDECITGDHNCSEKCTNAQPGYVCNCFNGTAGCFGEISIFLVTIKGEDYPSIS